MINQKCVDGNKETANYLLKILLVKGRSFKGCQLHWVDQNPMKMGTGVYIKQRY